MCMSFFYFQKKERKSQTYYVRAKENLEETEEKQFITGKRNSLF